jgi:hypothetical protein
MVISKIHGIIISEQHSKSGYLPDNLICYNSPQMGAVLENIAGRQISKGVFLLFLLFKIVMFIFKYNYNSSI